MRANTHRSALSVAFDGQPHRRRFWPAPVVLLTLVACAVCVAQPAGPKVAVLDFRAAIGGAPPDFGTTAARLVAGAFQGTGKYEVCDYDVVRQELAKRELRPPFGVGHLQLLADVLKADLIVHGSVRSLTYDAEKRAASVVLSLEMVDGPSGNLKKRAEVTGSFTPEAGTDQSAALLGALTDATRRAVESTTGMPVRAEAPKVTVPPPQEAPESSAPVPATAGLAPPLLPPVAVAESLPRTTTPAADLKPGAPPAPKVSVVMVQGPKAGGRTSEGTPSTRTDSPGGTPPRGTVTILPEVPPEEPVGGEGADENATPLVRAKVLAKLERDRVLITLGKDAVVAPKMEMDVYRVTVAKDGSTTKRHLGRIRVVKINPTDAEARVLEGGDLMATGDYAYYYGD